MQAELAEIMSVSFVLAKLMVTALCIGLLGAMASYFFSWAKIRKRPHRFVLSTEAVHRTYTREIKLNCLFSGFACFAISLLFLIRFYLK